jgi:hypothetical protein
MMHRMHPGKFPRIKDGLAIPNHMLLNQPATPQQETHCRGHLLRRKLPVDIG